MKWFVVFLGLTIISQAGFSQNYVSKDTMLIPFARDRHEGMYSVFRGNGEFYFFPCLTSKLVKSATAFSEEQDSIRFHDKKKNVTAFEAGCFRYINEKYYAISNSFEKIYTFNDKGKLVKKAPIKKQFNGNTYVFKFFNEYNTSWPDKLSADYFLIKCHQNNIDSKGEKFFRQAYLSRSGLIAKLDMKGKIANVFGSYPEEYKSKGGMFYAADYFFNTDTSDNTYLGFEGSPLIKKYDKDGILVDSFGVEGRHISFRNDNIPLKDMIDYNTYMMHYKIENPQYNNVIPLNDDYVLRLYYDGMVDTSGFDDKQARSQRALGQMTGSSGSMPSKVKEKQNEMFNHYRKCYYQLYKREECRFILIADEPIDLIDPILVKSEGNKIYIKDAGCWRDNGIVMNVLELKL